MDGVVAGAVERLAVGIGEIEGIDRILRQVGTETELGDDGALEIIVAVNAHGVRVHRPIVRNPGKRRNFPLHERLRVRRRAFQAFLDGGIGRVEIEALARLEADAFQARDDRLVGDMRRMQFEQLRSIGEEFSGRHGIDLRLRRRFHIDGGVDLRLRCHGLLAPLRERSDLVACLDLVYGVVVRRAVGLGAANDPDIGRRCIDACVLSGSLNSSTNRSRKSGRQPGGVIRKLPAPVPVVRQPGEANTSVHMSSIGRR